jgi:5-methyltetrahydrofolate--homocysteine methyltransferase
MTQSRLLQHLDRRLLVLDGAMGTSIHGCGLSLETDYRGLENCSEIINHTRPEVIQGIHESFLAAGSDAVETNTFGANTLVLAEFDLADQTRVINRDAAEIARAACEVHATADRPRFVMGSIGPGTKLVTLGQTDWDSLYDSYREQALGLIDGGVDGLLIETCQDLLQAKCAIVSCLDAMDEKGVARESVPIFVSITIETTGTMLVGSDVSSAATALRMYPIAGLGLNCATGPVEMRTHLSFLARKWDRHLMMVPNAGLPTLVDGQASYPLQPDEYARLVTDYARQFGLSVVGGCCGTTPDHITALVNSLDEDRRRVAVEQDVWNPSVSSLYGSVELRQDTSFLIVGERTNSNGSRKFRRLLNEEDWDGLVSMGREQVNAGAHVIDLCVDSVGRDGARDMFEVSSRFARQVQAPLMIDSTEADTLEAALKVAAGKCIVNSINLEDGEKRFDDVCPLLKKYGAAAVALTIDEDEQAGMAKTADRKIEIAERMHRLYTEKWGLDAGDLIFDPLTFTIATGTEADRRLALETLDGIERIAKRFPECGIILGVSNVSFGLKPKARHVLNSVFLHEALQRGLTSAIIHASKILPRNRISDAHWEAALNLIYDRRDAVEGDPLTDFIKLFEEETDEQQADLANEELTLEEHLRRHIIDGERQDLHDHLEQALRVYTPLQIINEHLLDGMRVVGELFGSGKMQLPFVLESAEVMKEAVGYLEPRMEKIEAKNHKGRLIIATVRGDVHDIGKNLVDIILSNNGFDVINLGIKQPIANIIEAHRAHEADAIGLSGLLVKSVGVMEENLKELNALDIKVPVLVGGAALSRKYAEEHMRPSYNGALYYGKDAFEALKIMTALGKNDTEQIEREIDQRIEKLSDRRASKTTAGSAVARQAGTDDDAGGGVAVTTVDSVHTGRSDAVDILDEVPQAPFLGVRLIEDVPLDEVYPYINTVALFRGQWGYKRGRMSREEYARTLSDYAIPTFERLKRKLANDQVLRPSVVYGYFACQADENDLVLYSPTDPDVEIERFTFPRQSGKKRFCIADFYRSVDSGERDVIGFFVCTVGPEVTKLARTLFNRDEYHEYLHVHGLGVETAEGLAELWHKRMREELGIAGDDADEIRKLFAQGYRGSRYSPGYPACPALRDQEKIWRLLDPERIGCTLTENWQIDPEQSVSAFVVHHPQARYFSV